MTDSPRQQLQEALADVMYAKVRDEGFIAADMAAAVMDALTEAGWVPRAEHEAALACVKRLRAGWRGPYTLSITDWWRGDGTDGDFEREPMTPAEQEVMSRG